MFFHCSCLKRNLFHLFRIILQRCLWTMKLHRVSNIVRLIFEGNFSFEIFIWSPKTVLLSVMLPYVTALDWTELQMDLLVTDV